jgi:hypothetical protein
MIDHTRRLQDGDRVDARVVQVPGMDHMDLSRIQKSLPGLGRVGLTGIIPRKLEKCTPQFPEFSELPLDLSEAGNPALSGGQLC